MRGLLSSPTSAGFVDGGAMEGLTQRKPVVGPAWGLSVV